MGWRYRRSLMIARGARINVSAKGVSSVSFGGPGASLNMGKGGVRTTVGLPGSGVSYSQRVSSGSSVGAGLGILAFFVLLLAAARGNKAAQFTLVGLSGFVGFLLLSGPNHKQTVVVQYSPATAVAYSATSAGATTFNASPAPAADEQFQLPITQSALAAPLYVPAEVPVVTTTGANVRAAASRVAPVLSQLPKAALLTVVKTEADWSEVRDESLAVRGWVHRSLLRAR